MTGAAQLTGARIATFSDGRRLVTVTEAAARRGVARAAVWLQAEGRTRRLGTWPRREAIRRAGALLLEGAR